VPVVAVPVVPVLPLPDGDDPLDAFININGPPFAPTAVDDPAPARRSKRTLSCL
jgi:hypothetical protein